MWNLLQIVYVALHQKPGGEDVIKEYNKTKGLSDPARKKLVNILVADMIESHGYVINKPQLAVCGMEFNLYFLAGSTVIWSLLFNPQKCQNYLKNISNQIVCTEKGLKRF